MYCVTCAPFSSDGSEEVFAALGESVSLSCGNVSSLVVSGLRAVGGRSPLVISKVSARHGGDYQCSDPTDHQVVLNKIRLHVLDGEN